MLSFQLPLPLPIGLPPTPMEVLPRRRGRPGRSFDNEMQKLLLLTLIFAFFFSHRFSHRCPRGTLRQELQNHRTRGVFWLKGGARGVRGVAGGLGRFGFPKGGRNWRANDPKVGELGTHFRQIQQRDFGRAVDHWQPDPESLAIPCSSSWDGVARQRSPIRMPTHDNAQQHPSAPPPLRQGEQLRKGVARRHLSCEQLGAVLLGKGGLGGAAAINPFLPAQSPFPFSPHRLPPPPSRSVGGETGVAAATTQCRCSLPPCNPSAHQHNIATRHNATAHPTYRLQSPSCPGPLKSRFSLLAAVGFFGHFP